ncbi:MAG: hypothetical protein RL199_2398 [Pseudomonadota bacterium]|jgi:sugar O-acyltransferase (sialic acid O-acetyltransferase NeuD family)
MPERLLLVGTGGQALVSAEAAMAAGHEVVGALGGPNAKDGLRGLAPVLGAADDAAAWLMRTGATGLHVAIGDNATRLRVMRELAASVPAARFVPVVHPAATLARLVTVGDGAMICAGAVVAVAAEVGVGALVNTRASIDHECRLGPGSSIGPGAVLGGNVTLGEGAVVALGASVLHGRTVGAHALVAAGATVTRDVADLAVVMGVPARWVRQRAAGERYL